MYILFLDFVTLHMRLVSTILFVVIGGLYLYALISKRSAANNGKYEISAGPQAAMEILLNQLSMNCATSTSEEKLAFCLKSRRDRCPSFTWVWRQFVKWLLTDPNNEIVNFVDAGEGKEAIKSVIRLYAENCRNPEQWTETYNNIKTVISKSTGTGNHFHALKVACSATFVMCDHFDTETAAGCIGDIIMSIHPVAENVAWEKALANRTKNSYDNYSRVRSNTNRQVCSRNLKKLLDLLSVK